MQATFTPQSTPPAGMAAEFYWVQTAALLQADPFRLACLQAVRALALPDWYLAAGFLRNAIWDAVHQQPMTALNDIDVVFFDRSLQGDRCLALEQALETRLQQQFSGQRFEVRNQARMHLKHGMAPYQNCADGIRRWVEQPTCVGVRLTADDQLQFYAPFGLALNWSLQVAINPDFPQPAVYQQRIQQKGWQQHWPGLQIKPV